MTFLELCQRTAQECGVSRSSTSPTTVTGQTGELDKIIDWVLTSYEDIQDKHGTWNFLRFDFSFPTIASTSTYLPSAVSLDEHLRWKENTLRGYLTSAGVAGQQRLQYEDWDCFRDGRQIGTIATGRPTEFSIRPDKSLVFYPTPGAIYTITGEYFKRAQTMTADANEPLIPRPFQMAIVWGAVMYYAADQGAAELYAAAEQKHRKIMGKLESDQLPRFTLGGPMA